MADKNLYNEDSIQSLSPREHIQLRPGMYAGDTSNPNQLLLEVFSNALDEHNIGHGNKIIVQINEDKSCRVVDEAQGFPIDVLREDGKSVLEAAFSVLNTSGKFTDDGVYEGSSLGLNGAGLKLTTFLSSWLEVRSWQNGECEKLRFEDGILVDREIQKWSDQVRSSGTDIIFKPDIKYFKSDVTDIKWFKKFFNDICCLCNDLTIELNGEIIHHNSIEDIIPIKIKDNVEIIDNRFVIDNKDFKLAMTFTSAANIDIMPYVNYGLTEQGPHITNMKSTITRVLNNWAKQNGLLKEKDKNLDGNAIQEGMLLVCNIVSRGVKYDAQVKTRISDLESDFSSTLGEQLEIWLDNNPEDATAIIEKALIARKAAEAAKKARAAVKAKAIKTENKAIKLPTTLTDCWTKDRSKAELLVSEGKSAASGLVAARDSKFQAVYGVRGKMLSVLKSTPAQILKNQEINNLIQALGLECNPTTAKLKYDKNKLRYNKIIACADADPDGWAIENLLFNILWYLCPDLIIEGHVYSSIPPLYRVTNQKNNYIYLRGDKELQEYKEKYGEKSIKFLGRMKGLGECDAEELSYTLLDPQTRNIVQLQVDDISKFDKLINNLYGKAVEPRVKFLEEHLEEAHID